MQSRHTRSMLSSHLLAGVLACTALANVSSSQVRPAGPPVRVAPDRFLVVPNYGTGEMVALWRDLPNETGYEILRAETGGALALVATLAANTDSWIDGTADVTKEYLYAIRARYGAVTSARSRIVRQGFGTVWPAPATHELLHGWMDTIGTAGQWGDGFHVGVDIQRVGTGNKVLAARGGLVTHATDGPNGVVNILYLDGASTFLVQTNHIDAPLVRPGQSVYPGQEIAKISERHFPVDFVDHIHFVTMTNASTFRPLNPLLIFSAAADRDPGGNTPGLVDHGGDGSVFYRVQGGGPLTVDATHPAHGDLDIIVELSDEMGTSPDQIPSLIAYAIEPPAPALGVVHHGVKSTGLPYVLFFTDTTCYSCDISVAAATALHAKLVDTTKNYGATIPGFPWQNFKHYVITNTKGLDGSAGNVDEGQYWNTNAKNDGTDDGVPHANFAGKPDTTKATEARFPDGDYTVRVHTADLVHNNTDISWTVRLENFHPIVVETDPPMGAELPAGTDEVGDLTVIFNEPMDMTVPAASILAIAGGATLHDQVWINPHTIKFTAKGLVDGNAYTLIVKALAKDRPGTPGGRALDGNKDGVGGDDYLTNFHIGF